MRVDDFEIEAPSDDIKWTAAQKAAYGKRSLPDVLKEIAENGAASAATYNRIPVKYRPPTIDLPFENPTPYDLFSIFISPAMLAVTTGGYFCQYHGPQKEMRVTDIMEMW